MVRFYRYYKKFVSHWLKELWAFGGEQVVGVILAVFILAFQIRMGLITPKDARATALATIIWPYLALLGVYLIIHLVRTPWKLAQTQEMESLALRDEITRLQNQNEASNRAPARDWVAERKGLSDRFQAISQHITVDWQRGGMGVENCEVVEKWSMGGLASAIEVRQCEVLCGFAGKLLRTSPKLSSYLKTDAIQNDANVWFYFLRDTQKAMVMDYNGYGIVMGHEGKDKIILLGTIHELARVSASACMACAALEA